MLKKLKENFDEYNLKARVYPTLVALIPIFLFLYLFLHDLNKINAILSFVSSSVLTIIILFLLSDIVRNLGKYMELKIFNNELHFPTTEFLLHANARLSKDKRIIIHNKVKEDYGCILCSAEEEKRDENIARQKIKEAVGLVRQKVANGRLLLGFNIRYGFWRNLIGSSLFSAACSIAGFLFYLVGNSYTACLIFGILSLFYLAIFVFRKGLLNFFGYQYADQLFLEYLS
jgi:hypothetical protein